jgi:cyclophilin family peptidyl-prolyl cis-trans isomerase
MEFRKYLQAQFVRLVVFLSFVQRHKCVRTVYRAKPGNNLEDQMRTTVVLLVFALLVLALAAGCPRKDGASGEKVSAQGREVTTQSGSEQTNTPPVTGEPGATTPPPTGDPGATTPPATGAPGETAPPAAGATTPPATGTATQPGEEASKGVKVVLETTKGKITIMVHKEWAPLGAAHFIELVGDKFYDGAPWFRVIDVPDQATGQMRPFVAQCGIAADPKVNEKWGKVQIQDEPVVKGNKTGFIAFGSGGPNTRSTHIFINLADNSAALDPQGFCCFAEVVEGMDVALKLSKVEYMDQNGAVPGWLGKFKAKFPNADYIVKATLEI